MEFPPPPSEFAELEGPPDADPEASGEEGGQDEQLSRDAPPKKRKGKSTRWNIPAHALQILEQVFQKDKFPTVETRKNLSADLKVTPRQVQVWFQNKRQRSVKPTSKGNVAQQPHEILNTSPHAQGDSLMSGIPMSRNTSNRSLPPFHEETSSIPLSRNASNRSLPPFHEELTTLSNPDHSSRTDVLDGHMGTSFEETRRLAERGDRQHPAADQQQDASVQPRLAEDEIIETLFNEEITAMQHANQQMPHPPKIEQACQGHSQTGAAMQQAHSANQHMHHHTHLRAWQPAQNPQQAPHTHSRVLLQKLDDVAQQEHADHKQLHVQQMSLQQPAQPAKHNQHMQRQVIFKEIQDFCGDTYPTSRERKPILSKHRLRAIGVGDPNKPYGGKTRTWESCFMKYITKARADHISWGLSAELPEPDSTAPPRPATGLEPSTYFDDSQSDHDTDEEDTVSRYSSRASQKSSTQKKKHAVEPAAGKRKRSPATSSQNSSKSNAVPHKQKRVVLESSGDESDENEKVSVMLKKLSSMISSDSQNQASSSSVAQAALTAASRAAASVGAGQSRVESALTSFEDVAAQVEEQKKKFAAKKASPANSLPFHGSKQFVLFDVW
ncbi:hypothetical protein AB1Y20_021019 [Prymnesium parvum]|uniref:Homeobox domain-containing protein n=1 Tax=Prymnesium parvum TaxID=97485 RepID=A0AB34JJ69_PRYPA